MIEFRLSGENLELSKAEVEALFDCEASLQNNIASIEAKISKRKIIELCERSSMIKRCSLDGKKIWRVTKGRFKGREPKEKLAFTPTSLKPKFAKLLVNLTGVKKGTILDPFCGGGSVLIEASLLGLKAIGIDADLRAIKYSKTNLKQYKLKGLVKLGNATDLQMNANSIDAIATDPPYGRSSKIFGNDLYRLFLEEAYKVLKPNRRLIMILPSDQRLPENKFEAKSYDLYVHKSLTRRVYVLSK